MPGPASWFGRTVDDDAVDDDGGRADDGCLSVQGQAAKETRGDGGSIGCVMCVWLGVGDAEWVR